MAKCVWCKREMTEGVPCDTFGLILKGEGDEEGSRWKQIPHKGESNCSDCNCPPGTLHHFNCSQEECPCCHGQLLSCGCQDED